MSGALASHARELAEGLAALGLEAAPELPDRLLTFGELLLKWNKVYNLTAIRDPREVITHHLLDALAVLPWVKHLRSLVDVGSGAGLPGIALALASPDLSVYSVETVGKKASFQQQAKIELRLDNFQVINRRVEAIPVGDLPCGGAEGVISRAFASLVDFVGLAGHLVGEGGALYAMKGVLPEAEMAALPVGWRVDAVRAITVPGLGAERCLVVLRRMD